MDLLKPEHLTIAGTVLSVLILFYFFRKMDRLLSELAGRYNGRVYRPYLGVGLGVEIPFEEHPVIFDPVGLVADMRRRDRIKRPALIFELRGAVVPRWILIERRSKSLRSEILNFAKKVDTGDAGFDREFAVFCRDESEARNFLGNWLRELLSSPARGLCGP